MTRTTPSASATTFVAFLRGINVGRARQVQMADLRDIAESLGYGVVRTHLRSGNLVFSAAGMGAERGQAIADELARAIEARLRMAVSVVVRSADELGTIVEAASWLPGQDDGSRRHVVFLAESLAPDVRDWLASDDFSPDAVRPSFRELYVWYEHGTSGSTTADRIGRRLPRTATDRNWNTVTRLLEMAGQPT
jgi:uncharacterized protein (DUF1697 family)